MVRKTISCMAIAVAAILASAYTLTGCQSHQGDEDQLENDIDSFATYYFNWQFPKTLKYCTQSSEPWLRYAASNVHQADVDLLRTKAEDATIEINDIDFSDDGANATVSITVYNFSADGHHRAGSPPRRRGRLPPADAYRERGMED